MAADPRSAASSALFDALSGQLWGRSPAAWTQPGPDLALSEADLAAGLAALRAQLEDGDSSLVPRIYSGSRPVGFRLDAHLPAPGEGLAAWEARLAAGPGGPQIGMVIEDAQSLGGALWARAVGVVRQIAARRGLPAGGCHAELFISNTQRSFFGVHKDSLETLTLVVRGRKRFLVWPFAVFADHEAVGAKGPEAQINLPADLDLEPYRDQATVLEGGPGDLLFWPASHWHVAEAAAPGFVSTMTVAFFPSPARAAGCPFRISNEAITRFGADGFSPAWAPYADPGRAGGAAAVAGQLDQTLRALLADPTVERARAEFGLSFATGWGFRRVPEEGPAEEISLQDAVITDADHPLQWASPDEAGFPMSVHGLVLTTTPAYIPMAQHLNAGGRFSVAALAARFCGPTLSEDDLLGALSALSAVRYLQVERAEQTERAEQAEQAEG